MLFTKCILKEPSPEDGLRISVMSRHTLNDGVTPDLRIKNYTYHIPMFGPNPKLLGKYLRGEISWITFQKEFLRQLKTNHMAISRLRMFADLALNHSIAFLCIEETAEFCHRRLLSEVCQDLKPRLIVRHL